LEYIGRFNPANIMEISRISFKIVRGPRRCSSPTRKKDPESKSISEPSKQRGLADIDAGVYYSSLMGDRITVEIRKIPTA
jgi:hypothetical protein